MSYRENGSNRDDAKAQRRYLVKKGKKTVVIPIEEYEELLEDVHDLAIVTDRQNEPTISFEELKKRLRKDGLL